METSEAIITRNESTEPQVIAAGVTSLRIVMVNVYFVDDMSDGWVLIDAGLYFSASKIRRAAEERFGAGSKPRAILLTHGHFDHVGSLLDLAETWDVPVYAHPLEFPYLTGRSPYPPPDAAVGKGAFSILSPLYPRGPIDAGDRLRPYPTDNVVPHLPDWRWIHTPGHTAGHVSFFRDEDRALIAGDALTTTQQEAISGVMTQKPELHGPPAYYTSDWDASRDSVMRLAELRPAVIACGHGLPLSGDMAADELARMALNFDRTERPKRGRYVRQPAITDETGIVSLPPPVPNPAMTVAAGIAVGLLTTAAITWFVRRKH